MFYALSRVVILRMKILSLLLFHRIYLLTAFTIVWEQFSEFHLFHKIHSLYTHMPYGSMYSLLVLMLALSLTASLGFFLFSIIILMILSVSKLQSMWQYTNWLHTLIDIQSTFDTMESFYLQNAWNIWAEHFSLPYLCYVEAAISETYVPQMPTHRLHFDHEHTHT